LNLLPKGTHNYEKFIRPSEIDGWARLYDLSISSMIGMTYNPITKKYKLDDDVSVNYIIHYKKKSGI
jgi:2-polyprenyl-6-hydroxyphenyl methylase/3-demethylubiquinone-9 3-methyltransferase